MKFFLKSTQLAIVLISILISGSVGLVFDFPALIQGNSSEIKIAAAQCNLDNDFPPVIYSINPPAGTYDNPGNIPVRITGARGGSCIGQGYPHRYETEFYYIFTDNTGVVVAEGTWMEDWCTPNCTNGFAYDQVISADSWQRPGQYTLYIEAITSAHMLSDSMTTTFNITRTTTPSFTCSVSPTTHTVDAGSDYAYNITSNAVNGFNSAVTYTAVVTPDTTVKPAVSLPGTGQVPPGPTVASVSTTVSTTEGTYTLTFTGTGGGETAVCTTEFIVNPSGADFSLVVSPSTAQVGRGDDQVYDVVAVCTGGLAGPIDNMTVVSSLMPGPTLTLGSTSIPCGGSTTLTVSNTILTNVQQLSDPGAISAIYNSITVTGRAQTN